MNGHFSRKPLSLLVQEAENEGEHTLKRNLGAIDLTLLGIGAIIGAGLFSITGNAAAHNAGPAITLSFLISAIGCAFAGLCYAEFASMIPVAGSAYTYMYATMGRLMAWIIGWDLVLEYAAGSATVAISWSRYLVKFLADFGLHLPPRLMMSPFESMPLADGSLVFGIFNLPAACIVIVISALLIRGTRESSRVNGVIVAIKVSIVLIFISLGWFYINPSNYLPYIPPNNGHFGEFGWSGIFRAAGIVFFAYIGFDAVSTAAQEAKNPRRDMPIGILVSLAICTILYMLFAHVMTGLAHYTEFQGLDGIAPVAVAIKHTPYGWLQRMIIFAILVSYTSVILVMLLGQSRIFFSMARDRLLPPFFCDVHPRFKTPWKSNLFFCLFVGLFSAFIPARVVGEMTSIGALLAFALVCAGIIVLRQTQPTAPRGFKTPFVPLIPLLGILTCFGMMIVLPLDTWLRLIIWMIVGLPIYFFYGQRRLANPS